MLGLTPFGQKIYATGGNRRAADYAGINTRRVRFISLMFSALCATMAGIIYVAFFRSFNPTAGQFRELDAIAAVIIGGGSIFGGYGTIIGSLAGAAAITLIRALLQLNIITSSGASFVMPQHWVNVFTGLILIVAVLIDIWLRQASIIASIRERLSIAQAGANGDWIMPDRNETTPIIEMRRINKSFGAVRALIDVDLYLMPGEILGLVGDNSAGKSTLMKILTGAYHRDSGDVLVAGKPTNFRNPHESRAGRHRDDLPGLRLVREHGCRPEHLSRPLAAQGPLRRPPQNVRRGRHGAEAPEGRRQFGLSARREPVGRPPAIGRHRARHLFRSARRHPRRADGQPLGHGDRAAAGDDARAEEARRRADHHLASACRTSSPSATA